MIITKHLSVLVALQVSDSPIECKPAGLYLSQLSLRHNELIMRSSDSGAFSIDPYS